MVFKGVGVRYTGLTTVDSNAVKKNAERKHVIVQQNGMEMKVKADDQTRLV